MVVSENQRGGSHCYLETSYGIYSIKEAYPAPGDFGIYPFMGNVKELVVAEQLQAFLDEEGYLDPF